MEVGSSYPSLAPWTRYRIGIEGGVRGRRHMGESHLATMSTHTVGAQPHSPTHSHTHLALLTPLTPTSATSPTSTYPLTNPYHL